MNESLLEVEKLCVSYGEHEVLQDVSLAIERGQFACLIGPNGAGKSTLLKTIIGLVPASSGSVKSRARQIGYVPQQLPLDPDLPLTVAEFLSLKLSRSRWWFGAPRSLREYTLSQLREIGAAHL